MDQKTHEYRLAQWEPIIKECRASGLPVTVWCKENDIDKQKFYYWQRRLRAAIAGETTPDAPNYQPPTVDKKQKSNIVELPMPIMEPNTIGAPIVLHIKDYILEINNNASCELINTIMMVMSRA